MRGGTSGASFSDRQLAGQVRNLALKHLWRVLQPNYRDKKYQREIILKIASSLLPRQTEITGEDGYPIVVELPKAICEKYGIKYGANTSAEQNSI